MRKVIFVGGTAYSGSTLLDMTLANDPAGFSCGELIALSHPLRAWHLAPTCGCGDPHCTVWSRVKGYPPGRIYEALFEAFPHVRFIVDSSKDPCWIASQQSSLARMGIAFQNILIWKTPLEVAHSYRRRGRYGAWERAWVNYHRMYFSLVDQWRSVSYGDFARRPAALEAVCRELQLDCLPGKRAYWEKIHHTLFGNDTAKVHLQGASVPRETYAEGAPTLRTVYYNEVRDPVLMRAVDARRRACPHIGAIEERLRERDLGAGDAAEGIGGPGTATGSWEAFILLRKGKWRLRKALGPYAARMERWLAQGAG